VENDPLRTSLILQAQKENYYKAIASFETEFNNLGKMKEFSQTRVPASFISQIQDIFRVNKAHALFGLGDITFDPSNLARMIWEYVQKVATEILKDQLVHRLVYQVINWVQGGGKPQFITNWNQFLQQAGNSAAGAAIQSLAPGMCRSFGPLIELQLERTYVSAPRITCTLDQVVRNVEDFYKRFENGSWIAYSAMSLPGGNYFGQLFEGSQIVELSQAAAKDSARAKSTASGGFLSKERCVEGDPDANPLVISKLTPGAESIVESYKADPNFVKIVDNSSDWSVYLCAENGWETTTPAKLVGDTMSEAIGNSPISRIVNAQDIAALVSALVNSGLNKLIKAGVRGVTGLVNGGAGENTGGTGGGGTPNACSGLSGQELADCQAINGSVSGSSNVDLSEQKVGLLKQADLFIDSLNNRIGYDRDWLSLSAQTQSLLEDVAQTCTAKASEIHSSITPSISQKSPTVSSDLENASSSLSNLMSIREDLTETSDVNQLLDLGSELNRLNATTISNAEEEAKTRYDNLTSLNQSARTALGDCNTQLSPLP
jgi:hypothetical protein